MCLEPHNSLLIGSVWTAVIAIFNKESSWLPASVTKGTDPGRDAVCQQRERVCWGAQLKPFSVRRGNVDMQSSCGKQQPLYSAMC